MINETLLHPADIIIMIMKRIYGYGMTTTSGGNLSIKDREGNIWITPGGIDKGALRAEHIVCVKENGEWSGPYRPSIELPFHKAVYSAYPGAGAVLHAHPPALVSFSITKQVPDTSIIPNARLICGKVGFAPYALPGSEMLGKNVADVFSRGHHTVIMENHGVVTAGTSLFQAFYRFETLDFCARLIIKAKIVGKVHTLSVEELSLPAQPSNMLPEFVSKIPSSTEKELRKSMCTFIHRACDQKLATSTGGAFSVRVDENSFLITPFGVDRKHIDREDMVLVEKGEREKGKVPSRSLPVHQAIYGKHRSINAVIIAHPPSTMAFGVSRIKIDTRTIPEAYVFLRDIPFLPFGIQYKDPDYVADVISGNSPVAMIENDSVIVTGNDILSCFDRLEITDFIADSIISAKGLGPLSLMDDARIQRLKDAFLS